MTGVNGVALAVLVVLFLFVTVVGFLALAVAAAGASSHLDEWGLGGRKFGTCVTWFLLGGDLYTAYTFVAVPAAMFATGAVAGFFAVPYTIVRLPDHLRLHGRGSGRSATGTATSPRPTSSGAATTPAALSLAVAVTGFLATMPYIALQLVGIQAVLEVAGLGGSGQRARQGPAAVHRVRAAGGLHLLQSGLRAPALIAFVKDVLIYLVIIVAVIYLPRQVGGWGEIFGAAQDKMATDQPGDREADRRVHPAAGAVLGLRHARARLGAGAVHVPALDHRVASSSSRNTIRRNAAILPAYSFVLGPAGPARLGRDRGGHQADRARRQAQRAAGDPAAVRGHVPERGSRASPSPPSRSARWCRRRSCRSPPPTPSPATSTRSGFKHDATPAQEATVSKLDVAGGQGVRAGLRADAGQAERDQLPAPRRHLDPADLPRDRVQPLHPLVPPVRPARRLGGRDGLRHRRGLPGDQPGHRQALRGLAGHDPGGRRARLHRADRVRAQPDGHARRHGGTERREGVQRQGLHEFPADYYADAGDPRVRADLASTDDLTRGEPQV